MKKVFKKLILALFICLILIVVVKIVIPEINKEQGDKKEVLTVVTLEKIINISELSTFTAIYNGIAEVTNKEKADQVDYYVSYEARIKAGIEFDKITIKVDNDEQTVNIIMPPVQITEINVDISSLDYIFYNDKANTASVSQEAFKACEADVENESRQQDAIFELATQNAKNILNALTRPIIEQMYPDYTLIIE